MDPSVMPRNVSYLAWLAVGLLATSGCSKEAQKKPWTPRIRAPEVTLSDIAWPVEPSAAPAATLRVTPPSVRTDRGVMVRGRFVPANRRTKVPPDVIVRLRQENELLAAGSGYVTQDSTAGSFEVMVTFRNFETGAAEIQVIVEGETPVAQGVFELVR